ncbi:MAG: hypothetical protein IJR14_12115, partial [Synergistaceae bacterium]|nr:hypothetical protein [Synergistaceae bacterium]
MNIVAFALSLFTAIASGVQTLFDVNAAGWARSIAPAPVLGAGLAIMTAALLGLLGGGMALTRRERAPFVLSVDAGLCVLALLGGLRAGAIWAALYLISAVVARVDMGSLDEGGEDGGVARLGATRVLRAIHVFLESPMDAQGRVRILPDEGGEALIGFETGALIRRAFLFLEDGDFARADLYLEQALTQDPEEPRAYLGKLMAELGAHSVDELATWPVPFDGERSFQRALRFSSPGERERLEGLSSAALDRLDRRRAKEREELEDRYERALALRETATTGRDLAELTELLTSLGEYKDAPALAQEAGHEAELEERYERALALRARARTASELDEALELLSSIEGYKDVDEILADAEHEKEYLGALALKDRARGEEELERVAALLEGLSDYRDAEGQAQDARRLAKEARRALRAAIARREVLKRWGLRLAWIAVLGGFLALGGGRWVAGLFGYVPANDASWP